MVYSDPALSFLRNTVCTSGEVDLSCWNTSSIIAKTVSDLGALFENMDKTEHLHGAIFSSYRYGDVPANATFPEPIILGLTILF